MAGDAVNEPVRDSGPDTRKWGCGRRAAHRKRLDAPLVGAQLPRARSGLVDGAPDEWVAEPEAPRHVGRADEIDVQELVDRVHRRGLGDGGCGSRQVQLEGIAGHRRSLEPARL